MKRPVPSGQSEVHRFDALIYGTVQLPLAGKLPQYFGVRGKLIDGAASIFSRHLATSIYVGLTLARNQHPAVSLASSEEPHFRNSSVPVTHSISHKARQRSIRNNQTHPPGRCLRRPAISSICGTAQFDKEEFSTSKAKAVLLHSVP